MYPSTYLILDSENSSSPMLFIHSQKFMGRGIILVTLIIICDTKLLSQISFQGIELYPGTRIDNKTKLASCYILCYTHFTITQFSNSLQYRIIPVFSRGLANHMYQIELQYCSWESIKIPTYFFKCHWLTLQEMLAKEGRILGIA